MKIIQIGVNNGKDHCNKFIKIFPKESDLYLDYVLLIEPLSRFNSEIIKNYDGIPNVHIEHLAVTDTDDDFVNFYVNDAVTGHSSINIDHIFKTVNGRNWHTNETVKSHRIKAERINSILNRHNLYEIDVMFIDTEGMDARIILDVDFKTHWINYIFFEHLFVGEYEKKLLEFLREHGFLVSKLNGSNSIAVRGDSVTNRNITNLLKKCV